MATILRNILSNPKPQDTSACQSRGSPKPYRTKPNHTHFQISNSKKKLSNAPSCSKSAARQRPRKITPKKVVPVATLEQVEKPYYDTRLKFAYGVNAWNRWINIKNSEIARSSRRAKLFIPCLLQITPFDLSKSLCMFVKEVRKSDGSMYAPDVIFHFCMGIQLFLYENGRIDDLFIDRFYSKFTDHLNEVCGTFNFLYNDCDYIVTCVEEEHLWESKQFGLHSPYALLNTLIYFNLKYFNISTVEEHAQISFSNIQIIPEVNVKQVGSINQQLSKICYFPSPLSPDGNLTGRKKCEQLEDYNNPRCPVRFCSSYLATCPKNVRKENKIFYLNPARIRSRLDHTSIWYSTSALDRRYLEKILNRLKLIMEINVTRSED